MLAIGIKADLKPLHRAMIDLGARQVPFAMALALTSLAKGVATDEVELIDETFKSPAPFTEKAYRIEAASKARPVAVVAMKDIQAEYLEPYVIGGKRFLGTKKGMLAPRAVTLNRYGNLPRGKMKSLQGKPNVYVGPVKTKGGKIINGVWQRPSAAQRRGKGGKPKGGLKLLIRFEDTTPVPKRLPFEQRARSYISTHAREAFNDALRQALATARR